MTHDELNDPLGVSPELDGKGGKSPGKRALQAAMGVVAVLILAGAGWLVLSSDDGQGRARAVARIERSTPGKAVAALPAPTHPGYAPADLSPTGSIRAPEAPRNDGAEIENASGVKVVRRGGGDAPGALIIQIPDAPHVGLPPAPDPRLVQRSRFGLLPVAGKDGSKPLEVYARPLVIQGKLRPSAPRIAIVVGGMGLSRTVTALAVERLPAAISLAFAPYGEDLQSQVNRARSDGHEIILQVPMEPFDLAGPGPGPHMLRTSHDRKQMKEALHWHMGRFVGYIGIANFLGAKFSAEARAMAPLIEEVRSRGLMYLDDGSSARSLADRMSASTGTPFVRAEVILDERRDRRAIDAALLKLESLAVRNGAAVGIANGLPIVVDQIAKFVPGLEKRGIALVPVSTMTGRTKAVAQSDQ